LIRDWRKPGINNNLKYRRHDYEEDDDSGNDDGHDYLGQRNELLRSKERGTLPQLPVGKPLFSSYTELFKILRSL
jgi:hypothetical protein